MKQTKVYSEHKGMNCSQCDRYNRNQVCDINKKTEVNQYCPLFVPRESTPKKRVLEMYQDHFNYWLWEPLGIGINQRHVYKNDPRAQFRLRNACEVAHSWQNMSCKKCNNRNTNKNKCEYFGFTADWNYCKIYQPGKKNSLKKILQNWRDQFQRFYLEPNFLI